MENNNIFRMIDANLNRSREGLRVLEDYFRFISKDNGMRIKIRKIRHSLSAISSDNKLAKHLIKARDTRKDLGKEVDSLELKRKDIFDVVYANFQRAKESLRVIEELFKITQKNKVALAKRIRYKIYAAEKQTFETGTYLRNPRQKNNR